MMGPGSWGLTVSCRWILGLLKVSLVDLMRRMITPVMITLSLKTKTSTKSRVCKQFHSFQISWDFSLSILSNCFNFGLQRLEQRNLWFGLGYHNRHCASLKKKVKISVYTKWGHLIWFALWLWSIKIFMCKLMVYVLGCIAY